ncbi:hypothetical protein ACCAA_270108 [Candidatus Accumulibacter aalborgensis]|uniref:Transposase IS801/IS1294 domain-containing protein n=1 Tax=Candidatus Accumulibacter aalborgensis TaxID=1860102 RepID=A0A1A8XN72_9PROT|nr:hypothetical protein ACCAA_270108 [Candidatus Accumulibacter aalborgensis]
MLALQVGQRRRTCRQRRSLGQRRPPRKPPPPTPLPRLRTRILANGFARARCAKYGFSLDASVRVEGADRQGLERLLRYCARQAFALKRLREIDAAYLVYESVKPGPGGGVSLLLTPLVVPGAIRLAGPSSARHPTGAPPVAGGPGCTSAACCSSFTYAPAMPNSGGRSTSALSGAGRSNPPAWRRP